MKRRLQIGIATISTLLLFGCPIEHEIEYVAEIESNTSWVMTYQRKTLEGFGHRTIDLPPANNDYDLPVCAKVKKKSIRGFIKARIAADSGVSILGSHEGEWIETYESFGEIRVCSKE